MRRTPGREMVAAVVAGSIFAGTILAILYIAWQVYTLT